MASIFVRHPDTRELFVNFDPQILTLIHETEYMGRLGLEIPPLAKTLRAQQETFKSLYNSMTVSTTRSSRSFRASDVSFALSAEYRCDYDGAGSC
jgi:dynein heavy chain